ncbi:MAG: hypothetical protein HYZ10_08080 [Ignavibacteriales bacterium]|nr:hypothetical protein [Ignavibacteriales bacterium]
MDENTKKAFYTVLCGFTSCLVFGLLFYGLNIFNTHDIRFQIVLFGLFGSVVYAVMNYRTSKEIIYVAFQFLIITFIVRAKTFSLNTLITDVVLITAIYIAIYYYKLFTDKNSNLPLFFRAFILLVFFGLANVLGVVFLFLIHGSIFKISMAYLLFYIKIPALIGLALGIGFDFFEKYKEKLLVL